MPDTLNFVQKNIDTDLTRRIAAARADIPPGKPGECELCGEWSGRLINGACAPCRDKYEL